jgi:hypothetical protein
MDANALVGSWTLDSGDSHLEFKADGTYIRVSSVIFPTTYANIALDDEEPFSVSGDLVILTPTSGHYRRDGHDEGFDKTVRTHRARLESNGNEDNLILDDQIWTKDQDALTTGQT